MNRRGFCAALAMTIASPRLSFAGTIADAIDELEHADYIAIGERHDNPEHHRLQAELVEALAPSGLAFEMVPRELEGAANLARGSGATAKELGETLKWAQGGWPDWAHYAPIFEAAPAAYIAGGGLSKSELGAVYRNGASGVGEALSERYELADSLPTALRAEMLNEQFAAHCEMVERKKLGAMIEVQRAWDAAYADAWHRAGAKGGGRSVLICGNAHARLDRGAPAYLLNAYPDAKIASIGLLEGDEKDAGDQFSITISAPAPEREDPCDRMRDALKNKG